jgi:hypothetical protein
MFRLEAILPILEAHRYVDPRKEMTRSLHLSQVTGAREAQLLVKFAAAVSGRT